MGKHENVNVRFINLKEIKHMISLSLSLNLFLKSNGS